MAAKRRRIAAIDVGTNSIHMIIVECRGRSCRVIDKEKEMVQLGEGSLGGAPLTPEAIARGVAALSRMADIAARWEVDQVEAVATSAVREAPNRRFFVREVEKASGIRLRVISGHEEADLIFRAVRGTVDFQGNTALSIDIGGGSVELIVGTEKEIFYTTSEPLGVLRLTQKFLPGDPPDGADLKALRKHVQKALRKPVAAIRQLGFDFCMGSSGTITTLAELASNAGGEDVAAGLRWLERDRLEELIVRLAGMTVAERVESFGLEPERASTIVAGAVVLHELMERCGVKKLRASAAALREGMIDRVLEENLPAAGPAGSVRRRSVTELAERSDVDREHAAHVARLALRIFDQSLSLHQLRAADRELLEYAALLHEIGLHVSWQGHHKHSYYLIRHAGLRGFTDDQVAVLANLARYHRKAKPSPDDENLRELAPAQRRLVERATAILRMADALDRGRKQSVRDVAVETGNGKVRLRLRPRLDAALELEAASKRAGYFAKVFGRKVEVTIEGAV